ncbi:hypothetical protein C723_0351 [Christiangramia flava JLT2011]|uniref:Uncharacterized protein n=1 Tax=Christiangramia flava JLT2011 TaxID=1229726 RepID=A0A1L7I3W9_9FLAO|nr:hypothetical protein GRFL_1547 [Christiangramia flava JLT2011]OSS40942.1 hypothetical protein C723_0351 [Christiangramia flava JLT2011]
MYQSGSVSLKIASEKRTDVKITDTAGRRLKFNWNEKS